MSLWTATDNNAGKPKFDAGADVFGVDTTEISAGSDNVVSITVNSAGTGYASAPAVTVGGNTTSTATILNEAGKVVALSVTGTNDSHTSVPAVTIAAPAAKQFNGASNVAANAITENSHAFATGDALTYTHSGGSVVVGLTNATVYYATAVTSNTLSLALTYADAIAGTVITLADGSGANHYLTGTTATGTASLGSGNYTHAGWVKRTVGTGGRAGRVQYETLVAMGSLSGDDNTDDTAFPDA